MRTRMENTSLGESKGTYSNTNSSIRQMKEKRAGSETEQDIKRDRMGYRIQGEGTSGSSMAGKNDGGAAKVAVGLLAGAGVGVLAGILLAPSKGQVTRRKVSDSAAWVGRGITDVVNSGRQRVGTWTSMKKSDKAKMKVSKSKGDNSMATDVDDEQQWS
jgi:gas vesicle protein